MTLECAGNGRALLSPRPVSQPWLLEAVGTAEWTGTPLSGLLEAAGVAEDAVEVVFRGLDRGIEGGEVQNYERSLSLSDALRDEVLVAWAMNGEPLPPQHGFPARLIVPGWYGMTSVKWLDRITVLDQPFDGYQQTRSYRLRQTPDEPGKALSRVLPIKDEVQRSAQERTADGRLFVLGAGDALKDVLLWDGPQHHGHPGADERNPGLQRGGRKELEPPRVPRMADHRPDAARRIAQHAGDIQESADDDRELDEIEDRDGKHAAKRRIGQYDHGPDHHPD